ncbi:helix-turn-helix domain-containing protein [Mastigocladopsis repens]|uniref:helix-turn-helix domain-containing protein n=1 Tax=Mastigocladopsis repens TaxID=221287 RepID=UPI0002DACED9|nr:helix-turn-helix domain-containing protein [Mastigocladopsis repens]
MSDHLRKSEEFESDDPASGKFLTPFQRKVLLKNLQTNFQPEYRRRLEIMLLADMGKSQTEICQILGCSQEMARYWIALAQAGLAHKWKEHPIGRPKTVNAEYIQRLQELVNHSPHEYGYSFKCWTAQWLSKHLAKEFGIEISDRHINRLLKQMGLSTKQKRSSSKQATDHTKDSSITISDLQFTSEPRSHWLFNLINTSK